MKRILFILIGLIYTWSVAGVTINTHYCGGKISSVSLTIATPQCGCGDSMPKDCCKDKVDLFKISDSHHSSGKTKVSCPINYSLFSLQPTFDLGSFVLRYKPKVYQEISPPLFSTKHFIEYCCFLI